MEAPVRIFIAKNALVDGFIANPGKDGKLC